MAEAGSPMVIITVTMSSGPQILRFLYPRKYGETYSES